MTRLPITPVAKPRMTQRDKWAKREVVQQYYAFKDNLRVMVRYAGYQLGDQVRLIFLLPMPQSWSKKKREDMNGKPHQQKPDVDNLCKSFLDSLTDDDSNVWNIAASKLWAEEGAILVENYEIK